jgi:ADP-ribose pyrophosphatase YjhB (NUDIX family)
MEPNKFSIAIVLKNSKGEILAVKRPSDDDSLPNVWGLPAVTARPGELPETAALRVGKEKLHCDIRLTRTVGIKSADRGNHVLTLLEIEAEISGGKPDVLAARTTATKYVGQKWTGDLNVFKEAAEKGSLCSQILLESSGVRYEHHGS